MIVPERFECCVDLAVGITPGIRHRQSRDGIERVAEIVRAMKEFSHPGGTEMTSVDINAALQSTVTVAGNEWKHVADLELDLDPALPQVQCLPGDVNQVFLNLIVNAAHAIGDQQAAGSRAKGIIRIRTSSSDDAVVIRITDTGGGIPEEIRERVFDPFFTTKEVGRGTGQGLAIAYNVIVNKHGGELDFTSEPGVGTEFEITLPICGSPAEAQSTPAAA